MAIKAIIFDIGGVLYKEPVAKQYSILCKKYGLHLQEFNEVRKKYSEKAAVGKLSAFDYPRLVAKDLGIKNIRAFYKIWIKIREQITKLDKDVEKTIVKLKKNYILGTLTNMTKTSDKIRKKQNAYKHFKIKLISNKIGLKKPGIKFYQLLIKKLKVSPKEIIFIDDRIWNIKPAKKLGIKTILFKNNKQLVKALKKLGVKI